MNSYSRYEEPPHRPLYLEFDRESSKIFTSRSNGIVEEWELAGRSKAHMYQTNRIFSYVSSMNSIITKNVVDNVEIFHLDSKQKMPLARDFYIHSAVEQTGSFLALSTGGKSLEMWSLDKKILTKTWETYLPVRNGVAISSGGKYMAAAEGSYDSVENFHHTSVQLWELNNMRPRFLYNNGEGSREAHGVWSIGFSPDATMIAVDTQVDRHAGVTAWETRTGKRALQIRGLDSCWVRALAFSPDGKYLATGDELGHLVVWSIDSQKQVWQGQVSEQVIYSIAFSPDGQRLAAGIQDSTIQVWEIELISDQQVRSAQKN